MKLVDIETKITAILWDDEHEQETEREMTVGEFLDEFTAEGLLEIPLYVMGAPQGRLIDADALRQDWLENGENEYVYDTNAFLDSLDNAPTIIPAWEGGA